MTPARGLRPGTGLKGGRAPPLQQPRRLGDRVLGHAARTPPRKRVGRSGGWSTDGARFHVLCRLGWTSLRQRRRVGEMESEGEREGGRARERESERERAKRERGPGGGDPTSFMSCTPNSSPIERVRTARASPLSPTLSLSRARAGACECVCVCQRGAPSPSFLGKKRAHPNARAHF